MSSREGRGRPRRDYPSRSEEKSHHGRGDNPPSRHLWVGNLAHSLTESTLAHLFEQFGDLETIAFQPGRSYAFVNFKNDDDSFAAIRELQGLVLGGNALRIEFAKAEKPRDAEYPLSRDELHPVSRGSPFSQRDSRARLSSPDPPYLNKSKSHDKDAEPSEVLWVGFPAQLKVDEFILRKAFSPFGEIEKITTFPGRTYAFVRFRNVMAACRAKETLHGKLFGNPRVHICFAKSESGTSTRERNLINSPSSLNAGSYGCRGSSEHYRFDRNFRDLSGDPSSRSPPYTPNVDSGGPDFMGSARNANLRVGGIDAYEQRKRKFPAQVSELGLAGNMYELPNTSSRDRSAHYRELSPHEFPQRDSRYDDPWDLPEDVSFLHGTKKLKTNSFPTDVDLPEYPLYDLKNGKSIHSHESGIRDANFESRASGYRPITDRLMNTAQPFLEGGDRWNASHDNFQVASFPLPPRDLGKSTPDYHDSSSKEVWKWEGIIARGGNSVCRARCFPVGKQLDMALPDYLDFRAKTGLDMLAQHYYQAASSWVVFFVPANDPDIAYYNDFMNFLDERQRAAVAKLDDRNTLFLVPPSEFSEKVLKVPGKLSLSGVVLRSGPHGFSGGTHPENENRESALASFRNDPLHLKPISPSGPYLPTRPSMNYDKAVMTVAPIPRNFSSGAEPPAYAGTGHPMSNLPSTNAPGLDYLQKPAPEPNWSIHDFQNSNSNARSTVGGPSYSAMPRPMQEASRSNYTPENSGVPLSGNNKLPVQERSPVSVSMPSLPAEQLAQLASSLLGQQGQYGEYRPPVNNDQSQYSFKMPQNYGLSNDQVPSEFSQQQFGQVPQIQEQPANFSVAAQRDVQAAAQVNPQQQIAGQEDGEGDPQKRLQATLQLAAALLQQIQQGKQN